MFYTLSYCFAINKGICKLASQFSIYIRTYHVYTKIIVLLKAFLLQSSVYYDIVVIFIAGASDFVNE